MASPAHHTSIWSILSFGIFDPKKHPPTITQSPAPAQAAQDSRMALMLEVAQPILLEIGKMTNAPISAEHLSHISRIGSYEMMRCLFNTQCNFQSIQITSFERTHQFEIKNEESKIDFLSRLIFSLYEMGWWPGSEFSDAKKEAALLLSFSEFSWTNDKDRTFMDTLKRVQEAGLTCVTPKVIEKIIKHNTELEELVPAHKNSIEMHDLESQIVNRCAPIGNLFRFTSNSVWGLVEDYFKGKAPALWEMPYWTRLTNNIELEINISHLTEFSVSQSKTYLVYQRVNTTDPNSYFVNRDEPLARITCKVTHFYKNSSKGGSIVYKASSGEPTIKRHFGVEKVVFELKENGEERASIEQQMHILTAFKDPLERFF